MSFIEGIWSCSDAKDLPFEQKNLAKEAFTRFKFVSYCPKQDQSVIKCYPKTGRTHQIRVHLQSLGFPIANDQMYGGNVINFGDDPNNVALK